MYHGAIDSKNVNLEKYIIAYPQYRYIGTNRYTVYVDPYLVPENLAENRILCFVSQTDFGQGTKRGWIWSRKPCIAGRRS